MRKMPQAAKKAAARVRKAGTLADEARLDGEKVQQGLAFVGLGTGQGEGDGQGVVSTASVRVTRRMSWVALRSRLL